MNLGNIFSCVPAKRCHSNDRYSGVRLTSVRTVYCTYKVINSNSSKGVNMKLTWNENELLYVHNNLRKH